MLMLDENDELFEVPADDCEIDGNGFWYLAADGEDEEEYYEFCDVECDDEDADDDTDDAA